MLNEEDDINTKDELFKRARESKLSSYTAPKEALEDIAAEGEDELFKAQNKRIIKNREDDYKRKKYVRQLSPPRFDPLKDFDKMPDTKSRTYGDIMLEQNLENERIDLMKQQLQKKKEMINNINPNSIDKNYNNKKSRLDLDQLSATSGSSNNTKVSKNSEWDKIDRNTKWENSAAITPGRTPLDGGATPRRKRWDLTPVGQDAQTPLGII